MKHEASRAARIPNLFLALRGYRASTFLHDLGAGVTVGLERLMPWQAMPTGRLTLRDAAGGQIT